MQQQNIWRITRMHCNDKNSLPRLTKDELLYYLQQFADFSSYYQCAVFYVIIKNHLLGSMGNDRYQEYHKLVHELFLYVNDKRQFVSIIDAFLGETTAENITSNNIFNIVKSCIGKDCDYFTKTLIFNTWLFKNNLCPLLCFAFGAWQVEPEVTEDKLQDIIELTIMSVYRIVAHAPEKDDKTLFNDSGGVFDVHITEDKQHIKKYPKNYAALAFLAQQEVESFEYFGKIPGLKQFLPLMYSLDAQSKVLTHTFINGISGDDILKTIGHLTGKQKKQLASFYDIYMKYPEMRFLDVHPGNFIWEPKTERWFLIDLGLIPKIGSDYYKWDNFDMYFHNVWETRLWQMKNVPIRSLDYALTSI